MRALAVMVALAAACGGDPGPGPDGAASCVADTYAPGMARTGPSGLRAELVAAEPAPPQRFDNTWTVRTPGATVVAATPWMPAHNHGTPIEATVEAQGDDTFLVEPLNLWMPGLWEVRLDLDSGAVTDRVVFAFCIEE